MKKIFKFAALAALILPLMVACKPKIGDTYKLLVPAEGNTSNLPNSYDIYSLPGKGEPSSLASPSTPRTSSNRKLIRDNQLLVETANSTFNVQGARVE